MKDTLILIEEVRRLEATEPKTVSEANLRFMRYATPAPQLADALEAKTTRLSILEHRNDQLLHNVERVTATLNDTTAALREERQNAEGLRERLAEAEKLSAVRDIAIGRLREMADECEAANTPPGGQQVRLRRMTVPPPIIKELRWIADEGNATWTYDEVRKLEARAKAAEERVRVLEKALEPMAALQATGDAR